MLGKDAVAGEDLKNLIDDFAFRARSLSRDGRALAHKVRVAANDVLHHQVTVRPTQ